MDGRGLCAAEEGRLGYDKQLFLLQPQSVDLTGHLFYQSVLQAWQILSVKRTSVTTLGMWLFEEQLFGNSYIMSQVLTSVSIKSRLREAGCVKLGHLVKTSIPHLAELSGVRSGRLLRRLVEEVWASLLEVFRDFVRDRTISDQWDDEGEYLFPPLEVCPAVGQWKDEEDLLLSLNTPQLGDFEGLGRKAAYQVSVKVSCLRALAGVKVSRWTEFFGRGSSPERCWRSLYKSPVDKRTGDLQWRIVHGAIATNRYLVHLNPGLGDSCPFCSRSENIHHLFVECSRLDSLSLSVARHPDWNYQVKPLTKRPWKQSAGWSKRGIKGYGSQEEQDELGVEVFKSVSADCAGNCLWWHFCFYCWTV
uniref:uncharacterized protein zgc:113625 isoform X1 n=1 Tax=Gasterosteus aculeatus aculeatus TaxID=481459 RepID=UPI001A991E6C|nr:uncharacterized protein zgc:113625 isoform X1 [Gasterosteus aculeatus aculeatus]